MIRYVLFLGILFFLYPPIVQAKAPARAYMSLKSNKVHMRVGPGKMYPIIWTYTRRGLPMKTVTQHNSWFQVQDIDGDTGWVYSRLLSGVRTAITTAEHTPLFHHPDTNSSLVAKLAKHVVVSLTTCRPIWCKIDVSHEGETIEGWLKKEHLWGIEQNETFEE